MTTTPKNTARDEAKRHLRDHFAKAGPAIATVLAKHETPTVHDGPPSGFHFADRLQAESFYATGSIDGASKVCFVRVMGNEPDKSEGRTALATRLRPPRDWPDAMILAYKAGWKAGKALDSDNGIQGEAFWKGYRDAAENRMKWHLAYCTDHGDHDGGCGA